MTGRADHEIHPADADLLTRLGAIAAVVDPVPEALVAMGKGLFAFRDPDAALMEIVETLAVREGTAGEPASRMHFFEFDDVSLDVEITVGPHFCDILGVVVTAGGGPVPQGWRLVAETTSARFSAAVEADGRFSLTRVPQGMLRFRLERDGASAVATPWVDAR